MTEDSSGEPLRFHGGTSGALAPFVLFLGGVVSLALLGAPDERGFWPVLVAALTLGLLLAADRTRYAETVLRGMSQPIVLLMVMAWLAAGILGTLMGASGFVEALISVAHSLGLVGGGFAVATFLICCLVSTSTGTSLGTLLVCTPLLYPAGAVLGTDPAVLIGALLGGATFGDNISPISDTTIASATTQGAEIGPVVRSRLRYALPAAALALLLYGALGGRSPEPAGTSTPGLVAAGPEAPEAAGTAGGGSTAPASVDGSRAALPMLAVPLFILVLLLARRHLLEGLLFGIVAAIGLGLLLGLLQPAELLYIDRDNFVARGLILTGMERAVGVSIFTLLLMGLVAGVEETGLLERLVGGAERRAASPRSAEIWIFATISAAVLVTTHSVVAILSVGPFVKRTDERFGLSALRRANLLDVTVCTYPFLLPYCIPTILAASLTANGLGAGMPRLSALVAGLHNFHSWALLLVIVIAVLTGFGRRQDRS